MAWLQIAGGLVALWLGAEWLVRGAAALAHRLGLSSLVIGLTVVAFGTSAPELAVSLRGALTGLADVAVGNVVGSNIANLGLILGLAALLRPVVAAAQLIRREVPLMIAVSLLLVALLADGRLGRGEGVVLVLGIVAYTAWSVVAARREGAEVEQEFSAGEPGKSLSAGLAVLAVGGGLAVLVGGATVLVDGAVTLARAAGLSEAVIGLTLVAVGTSLPELATSTVAAVRGQGDIAAGNVIGSNIFNLLCILGVAATVRPLAPGGIGIVDLAVMVGFAVAVLPMLVTARRLSRWEGAALLAGYLAYTVWLLLGAA